MRLLAILLAIAGLAPAAPTTKDDYLVYFGTFTNSGKSKGIYVQRFNAATGKLDPIGLAAESDNPAFLAIHPNRRYLYAVNEVNEVNGQKTGAVSAFSIDKATGKLTFLNKTATKSTGPCHLNVDHTGKNVLVANYAGGGVTVIPLNADGSLKEASQYIQHEGNGPNAQRQEAPHAHSVNMSKDNRFAIVADLGLDQVKVYRFDPAAGKLTPNEPAFMKTAPAMGPRHFAFNPKGKYAYVINEMASSLTAMKWDPARGTLTEFQTLSTLPGGNPVKGNSTAEVIAHPSGKFVYGSNRGHNSIAVFKVGKDGKLTHVDNTATQGGVPRNFVLDPTGRFLLAENSNTGTVVVFRIDQSSGKLTPTGQTVEVPEPVCGRFVALKGK